MEWLFTFLIVAVVVVVYVAVQKNSPANRQARAANEALSRVGTAWDRAPADQRNHILLEVGVDSASARNTVIVKPWAQLGIQLQTTIALRSGLVEQFLGNSSKGMGQGGTTGPPKIDEIPYFEAVRDLAMRLSRSVPLPEWATGAPTDYSPREVESIERFRLAMIRSTPDALRSDIEEPLGKLIAEIGLIRLARRIQNPAIPGFDLDDAADCGALVSIYLKAWLSSSDPFLLLDVAELLCREGKNSDAITALAAAARFPAYAQTRKLNEEEMSALAIVRGEFPPGMHRSAHEDRQGIYSPKAISLLTDEIARIQIGLSAEKAPVPSSENGPDGKVSPMERAEIDPRLDPDQYPTPERIKELWEAWEKGPEALLQALKQGAQEDKIQENLPQQVKQDMEGPLMFGFGRKAEKDRMKPTAAMVEGYSAVKMKFPGVIPRSGTAIGDLAFEIAGDLSNRFSRATFERVRQGWAFSPGWTESDALSRWYALGFICLMNCLQNSQWTEALTLDAGLKVHDAATELLWVLWSPPEPVKEKVRTFMRENIKEITRSLDAFSIPASRRSWFINYAERIKGTNPTWDTRGGFLSQVLAGEQPSTDMLSGNLLMSCFGDARKSILDLVSGARTGISFSNLPAGG